MDYYKKYCKYKKKYNMLLGTMIGGNNNMKCYKLSNEQDIIHCETKTKIYRCDTNKDNKVTYNTNKCTSANDKEYKQYNCNNVENNDNLDYYCQDATQFLIKWANNSCHMDVSLMVLFFAPNNFFYNNFITIEKKDINYGNGKCNDTVDSIHKNIIKLYNEVITLPKTNLTCSDTLYDDLTKIQDCYKTPEKGGQDRGRDKTIEQILKNMEASVFQNLLKNYKKGSPYDHTYIMYILNHIFNLKLTLASTRDNDGNIYVLGGGNILVSFEDITKLTILNVPENKNKWILYALVILLKSTKNITADYIGAIKIKNNWYVLGGVSHTFHKMSSEIDDENIKGEVSKYLNDVKNIGYDTHEFSRYCYYNSDN